jgi:hypothetical protein
MFLLQHLQLDDWRRCGEGKRGVLGDPCFASAAADCAARHEQYRADEVARQIVDEFEAVRVDVANL